MDREFRYELWVPHENAKQGRDRLFVTVLDGFSEPQRGPDVPPSPDAEAWALFYVRVVFFGLFWRRGRRKADRLLAQIARDLHGHVYRTPLVAVHETPTSGWAPSQSLGPRV